LLPSILSIIFATAMILDNVADRCHWPISAMTASPTTPSSIPSAVRRIDAAKVEMRASG